MSVASLSRGRARERGVERGGGAALRRVFEKCFRKSLVRKFKSLKKRATKFKSLKKRAAKFKSSNFARRAGVRGARGGGAIGVGAMGQMTPSRSSSGGKREEDLGARRRRRRERG